MRLPSTYLSWVDFSRTGLKPQDVADRFAKKARLFVSPGAQFGPGGDSWLRINFATPRKTLTEALDRIDEAFRDVR